MNTKLSLLLAVVPIVLCAPWTHAEQPTPPHDQAAQPVPASSAPQPVAYVPPHRGAPAPGHRVGGGSRSLDKQGPVVSVLAPDHVGLTAHGQPTLYWFVSEPVTTPTEVEVIVMEADGVKPILRATVPPPIGPGIQQLRLADHHVYLMPGAHYEWSVALVLDPKRRSRDIVVSGGIERVTAEQAADIPTNRPPSPDTVARYAKAGLWYDTIMSVSDLIAAAPMDQLLRQQRAELLDAAGLKEISAYDRRH